MNSVRDLRHWKRLMAGHKIVVTHARYDGRTLRQAFKRRFFGGRGDLVGVFVSYYGYNGYSGYGELNGTPAQLQEMIDHEMYRDFNGRKTVEEYREFYGEYPSNHTGPRT